MQFGLDITPSVRLGPADTLNWRNKYMPNFSHIIQNHKPIHLLIAEELRRAIRRGDLDVGEKLALENLGKQFGVSRMPVREALIRLEREGLVEFHARRGAVVASISRQEIEEITHLRLMLEVDAFKTAAGRFQPADFVDARDILSQARETTQLDRQADLHWQFHHAIYAPCDRPIQIEMIDTLHANVDRFFRKEWRQVGLRRSWIDEHEMILKFIESDHAAEAARMIEDHMLAASERVKARLG